MVDRVVLMKEELRRKVSEELEKLKSDAEIRAIIERISEIEELLDDFKLRLLRLRAQQLEPEEIDDELYEELDKISEELLKNPEKCLSDEEAVEELLS